MIKNKALDIKIIFKNKKKQVKNILKSQIDFYSIKHQKTFLKNSFKKLF